MARFIVLAATLAVLFASVIASSYHATITTVEMNDENLGQSSQRCRQQIQRQQQLNACQRYLRDSCRFTSMPENQGDWRQEFPRCCAQLEHIDEQCRCEALQQIVQEQQQQGELRGRERREMLQTAQSLPSLCRMRPQRCDVGASSWVEI